MAVNPISHQEILAWSVLYGIRLSSWELQAITGIDLIFINSLEEPPKDPNK